MMSHTFVVGMAQNAHSIIRYLKQDLLFTICKGHVYPMVTQFTLKCILKLRYVIMNINYFIITNSNL